MSYSGSLPDPSHRVHFRLSLFFPTLILTPISGPPHGAARPALPIEQHGPGGAHLVQAVASTAGLPNGSTGVADALRAASSARYLRATALSASVGSMSTHAGPKLLVALGF